MSDFIYAKAKNRMAELSEEINDLKTFIRMHESLSGVRTPSKVPTSPRRLSSKLEIIGKAARDFIVYRGEPMTRRELVEAFRKSGSPIGGADPFKNMGTHMWRLRNQFLNIKGRGYWPRDVPRPESSDVVSQENGPPEGGPESEIVDGNLEFLNSSERRPPSTRG